MFCSLECLTALYVGQMWVRSKREAGLSMANNKRGPEPGSQKAKHGGQAVREKYGPEFYSKIGKKGGETVKEKHGPQFYAEIGKKGGESTKRQQGSEFWRLALLIRAFSKRVVHLSHLR